MPISALRGDGLVEVVAALVAAMPEGPVYFPEGELSRPAARAARRRAHPRAGPARHARGGARTPSPSRSSRSASAPATRWSRSRPISSSSTSRRRRSSSARAARRQAHRQRRPARDRGGARRAGVPRAARQGAQALAARRPLRRPPALTDGAGRSRFDILEAWRERDLAGVPPPEGGPAQCTPKSSPRRSTIRCCVPTRPARTSKRLLRGGGPLPFRGRVRAAATGCPSPAGCSTTPTSRSARVVSLSLRLRRRACQGRGRRRGRRPPAPTRSTS